jgi:hypothetical protein
MSKKITEGEQSIPLIALAIITFRSIDIFSCPEKTSLIDRRRIHPLSTHPPTRYPLVRIPECSWFLENREWSLPQPGHHSGGP